MFRVPTNFSSNNASCLLSDYYSATFDFVYKYNLAIFESGTQAVSSILNLSSGNLHEAQDRMRAVFNSVLDRRLNEESFASNLAAALNSWIEIMDLFKHFQFASNFSDYLSYVSRQFEPLRDNLNRTPSEIIGMKGRFNLLHYKTNLEQKQKTPLLVVYSLINRHYILDLLPKYSVIDNLLSQGFDIFATDWGTPYSYDKDLTLEDYGKEYVGNAVEKIKEITGSKQVSLFGYCWGGIFTLIYAATHPENVKSLILHAAPVDIRKGKTILENWTSHVNADRLVQTIGNVPGWIFNSAFLLLNPFEAVSKIL
jgi:polyhydroxyalkanoate synthase subunit PhaC